MPGKAIKSYFISKIQGRIWTWFAEDDLHCLIFIFLLKESLRIFSLVFLVSSWQKSFSASSVYVYHYFF